MQLNKLYLLQRQVHKFIGIYIYVNLYSQGEIFVGIFKVSIILVQYNSSIEPGYWDLHSSYNFVHRRSIQV